MDPTKRRIEFEHVKACNNITSFSTWLHVLKAKGVASHDWGERTYVPSMKELRLRLRDALCSFLALQVQEEKDSDQLMLTFYERGQQKQLFLSVSSFYSEDDNIPSAQSIELGEKSETKKKDGVIAYNADPHLMKTLLDKSGEHQIKCVQQYMQNKIDQMANKLFEVFALCARETWTGENNKNGKGCLAADVMHSMFFSAFCPSEQCVWNVVSVSKVKSGLTHLWNPCLVKKHMVS